MAHLATITSKRQLTIPADVFEKADLSKGDKVLIEEHAEGLFVRKARTVVEQLAGSVEVPEHLRGVDPDEAIARAKESRFGKET